MAKAILFVLLCSCCLPAVAQTPLPRQRWPAGVQPREQLPTARAVDYDFSDVAVRDIERWLRWLGQGLPVEASGELSGWLWAQRSAQGWFNLRDYRLEGSITSPELKLDRWIVKAARLRFGYAAGNWYVGRLQGSVHLAGSDATLGNVDVAVKLPAVAAELLEVSGKIAQVDLNELLHAFAIDPQIDGSGEALRGSGALSFSGSVPRQAAAQLPNWTAVAKLQLSGVAIGELTPATLAATAELKQGNWTIGEGQVAWGSRPMQITGKGRIADDFPFRFALSSEALALENVLRELQQNNLADQLAGQAAVQAEIWGASEVGIGGAQVDVTSDAVMYQGQRLEQLAIRGSYQPQQFILQILSGQYAGGRLSGTSQWASLDQITSGLPHSLHFSLEDLQLERLDELLLRPLSANENTSSLLGRGLLGGSGLRGVARGELKFHGQLQDDQWAWKTEGELTLSDFSAWQNNVGEAQLRWSKHFADSHLMGQLQAADDGLHTKFDVQLRDATPAVWRHTRWDSFRATGRIADWRLQLPPQVVGDEPFQLKLRGDFDLAGDPENGLDRGHAKLEQATIALPRTTLYLHDAILSITPQEFRLQQFRMADRYGRIAGAAIYRRQGSGEHQLNLRVVDLRLGDYARHFLPDRWHPLEGTAALECRLRKSAAKSKLYAGWQGDVSGTLNELRYRGVDVGQLSLTGSVAQEILQAELQGQVFGGQATLGSRLALPPPGLAFQRSPEASDLAENDVAKNAPVGNDPSSDHQPFTFDASLNGVQLKPLMAVLTDPRRAAYLSGSASLTASGQIQGSQGFTGEATLQVPRLQHDRSLLAKNLLAKVAYGDGRLQVQELTGRIAGGRIDASGSLPMALLSTAESPERAAVGELQFDAQRIQLQAVTQWLFPAYAKQFAGIVSYRGSARYQRQLYLRGDAHLVDGVAYGLPIQRGHGDLRVSLNPDGSLHQMSSRNVTGTALGGNFSGEVQLRGGARTELTARARVGQGKLEQLSRALGFDHIVGSGRFDAHIAVNSRDASSLPALNGSLQIDFAGGDAQSVPLLAEMGRYVPLLSLASTRITGGTMHALLGQGRLRIQDLLILGDAFWVVAQGSAGLNGGRLDIDAVLQTGAGFEQQLSQDVIQKLAISVIPQIVLLAEINDLLNDRSLYFHIGGTNNRPVLQVRAAQTIGKAILLNVRRQLLAAPTAAFNSSRTD
ncbi:MAG: hypothetical protein KDA45_01215 [Planctomycetales bacterium]|nr:hypothetical protein [Planctomycetales bacterium]